MKNLLFTLLSFMTFVGLAQQDKAWRLGLQWGLQGNHSTFSGGMENASARFHHNPFGGGAFTLIARYDHDKHWMLMTGLGFNSFGFEFALSENYSLRREEGHFSTLKSEFSAIEIPTMVHYKFNPNCKGSKWTIGAGFIHTLSGAATVSKNYVEAEEANSNERYIKSESVAPGGLSCMVRFAIGREKVLKRGGIISASLLF